MDITELRERMAALPLPDEPPPDNSWTRRQYELHQSVMYGRISSFLRWQTLLATMVVGEAFFVLPEWQDLMDDDRRNENHHWVYATRDPRVGRPYPLSFDSKTTGFLVNQAYHLMHMTHRTGVRVRELSSICEFGGGFGVMALLCHRLGFKGRYTICDLPEFCLLQEYYLRQTAPGLDVTWGSKTTGADLLIACHSLSEVPVALRDEVLANPYKAHLICGQDYFYGVQNLDYFKDAGARLGFDWDVHQHPHQPGQYYVLWTKQP